MLHQGYLALVLDNGSPHTVETGALIFIVTYNTLWVIGDQAFTIH